MAGSVSPSEPASPFPGLDCTVCGRPFEPPGSSFVLTSAPVCPLHQAGALWAESQDAPRGSRTARTTSCARRG